MHRPLFITLALVAAATSGGAQEGVGIGDPGAAVAGAALRGALPAEGDPDPIPVSAIDVVPPDPGGRQNLRVEREPPVTGAADRLSTNPPRLPPAPDDSFAALGLRVGTFLVFPAVELSAGYTTNAAAAAGGEGAPFLLIAPEITIRSDWSRHEARLALRGAYRSFDGDTDTRPTATAEAGLRLDLPARWQADFGASYGYQTQSLTDPAFPAGVDAAPGVHAFGGTAALSRTVGPLLLRLSGDADRTVYEDGRAGGVVVDQGDRTNSVVTGTLRVGGDGGVIPPFVEGTAGRRLFDRTLDAGGFARSATIVALRGGFTYQSEPVLTAEIGAGYRRERPDDDRLADLAGFTIDGTAVWSPRRLVTLTLGAATTFSPNATAGSGGSIVREGSVVADYAIRSNLTLTADARLRAETFDGGGTETTTTLGAGATWRLSRSLWLTARYAHQWLESPTDARRFHADSVTVGVRLQR